MERMTRFLQTCLLVIPLLTGCSYNPFYSDNHLTGSPTATAVGAGVGVGAVSLFRGSPTNLLLGGLVGATIGYYVTTLNYDSAGVIRGGGKVYTVGEYVGIYIPTDNIFEPNTAEFTPAAIPILDSTVAVLQRYPNHHIIISGNTSGFARPRWEQKLSEERAHKVATYLWNAGINHFKDQNIEMRKLTYVGYGDYFPISNNLHDVSLRKNSRIQITAYPSSCDLALDPRTQAMHNLGGPAEDDFAATEPPVSHCGPKGCDALG